VKAGGSGSNETVRAAVASGEAPRRARRAEVIFGRRAYAVSVLGTIVGGASGLLLPFAITYLYPDRIATDPYFLSAGFALLAVGTIATATESLFVRFAAEARLEGLSSVYRLLRKTAPGLLIAGSLLGAAFALGVAVLPLFSGPEAAIKETVATRTMTILIPLPGLVAVSGILSACLASHGRFLLGSTSAAMRATGGVIAAAIVAPQTIWLVAVGVVLGEATRILVLTVGIRRTLHRHAVPTGERGADWVPPAPASFLRLALPQVAALALFAANGVIDRLFAARLAGGSVTTVEVSEKLYYVPYVLITSGLINVLGARWSNLAAEHRPELRAAFTGAQRKVVPLALGVAVCGGTAVAIVWPLMVTILNFPPSPRTFLLYQIGLPFAIANTLSTRLIVVLRRTPLLPIIAGIALGANVLFDWIGANVAGVNGIAAASSAWLACVAVVSTTLARRSLTAYEHRLAVGR
jgi:peptidoglycan biosynthesis protein MviN/MurJ (putative lipid II flippase)